MQDYVAWVKSKKKKKKKCIDVAVLRGRPLTHVRSLSMQNLNPFIALFLYFSSRKLAEREHKGQKVRLFKDRHIQSTMGASIPRKRTRLDHRGRLMGKGTQRQIFQFVFFHRFLWRIQRRNQRRKPLEKMSRHHKITALFVTRVYMHIYDTS